MRCSTPFALTILLLSIAAPPVAAQAGTADADTREVQAYRLTLPKLKQLNAAMADLNRQRDADPASQQLSKKKKELAALSEKEDPTDSDRARMDRLESEIRDAEEADDGPEDSKESLTTMAQRMGADPRIAGALKRAGLAPREAATMQLAFFQVAFAVGLLESGTIKEIPKEMNPDNIRFLQANRAEIKALTALGKQDED
jgi:hypothetical protein